MYKLGILTSLYDDYAPQLLETIDKNIDDGTIFTEPFLVCNLLSTVKEDDFNRRLEKVKQLKHLGKDVVVFPSKDFKFEMYRKGKEESKRLGSDSELIKEWRREHDRALIEKLPQADSRLNVGYMMIMSEELHGTVNLHPAIPEIGPIGIWTKVMQEQAERPLKEIQEAGAAEELVKVLDKRENKAGGMLHFVTPVPDRGPVISYYEFSLTSPSLLSLFYQLALKLKEKPLEDVKKENIWQRLAGENGLIRREQFKGEEPLLILTYNRLTHDRWKMENRMLYVKQGGLWVPYPNGYCLNQEIGEWLRERGIRSLIR